MSISEICLIILSVVLFHEANQLSPFASVFPYAITSVLLLLSALLIFRSFKIEIKVEKEKVDTIKIFFLIIPRAAGASPHDAPPAAVKSRCELPPTGTQLP